MKSWFGGVFVSFLGLNEKMDVFLNYFKIKNKKMKFMCFIINFIIV